MYAGSQDEDKVVVNGISFHNAQVQGENALGGKKRRRELVGLNAFYDLH